MSVKIIRDKKEIFKTKVLNDVVISYKDIARLISINARIDNKKLTEYRAD
jgi:NAD kinase